MKDIISDIYNKHIPLKIYKKLVPYYNWELLQDYEQQMLVELYNIPTDKLEKLYINKELENYFGQICLNQLVNKKSTFNKLYETTINKSELTDYEDL